MTWRAVFAFALLVMIAASIGMAVAAVERSPGWFNNPGARPYFEEAVYSLVVYAGVIVIVVANRGEEWDEELQNAAVFGSISAVVELASSAVDHSHSSTVLAQTVNFVALLLMFVLWGVAGARTSRDHGHFRPGVMTAIMSAGVTMAIAVTIAFALELFFAPTSDATTWAAFSRSGWMDARAFAIANTFHFGFTNLWMGPAIGLIVGSIGAWIGKLRSARRANPMRA